MGNLLTTLAVLGSKSKIGVTHDIHLLLSEGMSKVYLWALFDLCWVNDSSCLALQDTYCASYNAMLLRGPQTSGLL